MVSGAKTDIGNTIRRKTVSENDFFSSVSICTRSLTHFELFDMSLLAPESSYLQGSTKGILGYFNFNKLSNMLKDFIDKVNVNALQFPK